MPLLTPHYTFYALQYKDQYFPDLDRRNMRTVENQLFGATTFCGSGVLTGWEVVPLTLSAGGADPAGDARVQKLRQNLAQAPAGSLFASLYERLGSPHAEWEWSQVLCVTQGVGFVGGFYCRTTTDQYIRLQEAERFYVWAEGSLCLSSDGIVSITVNQQEDYDQYATCTYLDTVDVVEHDWSGSLGEKPYIYRAYDENRRNDLFALSGALSAAIRALLYRHKHNGIGDNPEPVKLDTDITVMAYGPAGSTIFILRQTETGTPFTWDPTTLGIPTVRLNNAPLPEEAYHLDPTTGRLYLQNALLAGDVLSATWPLSPQTRLYALEGAAAVQAGVPVALTDGTTVSSTDQDGNTIQTLVPFRGDPNAYLEQFVVTVSGEPIDQGFAASPVWTVDVASGTVTFTAGLSAPHTAADIAVILTSLGNEIQGTLPGKRLIGLDAGTIDRGVIDKRRLSRLDHVGQVRLRESMTTRPTLRLFDSGDHQTFFPERPSEPLQYDARTLGIWRTQNQSPNLLIGAWRGFFATADGVNLSPVAGWQTDQGRPIFVQDLVMESDPNTNYFQQTFVLTAEGEVYYGQPAASAIWKKLRLPLGDQPGLKATALAVTTLREEEEISPSQTKYVYSAILYLGTNQGLYVVQVREDAWQSDQWGWGLPVDGFSAPVRSLLSMVSRRFTVVNGEAKEEQRFTLYVGADDGLWMGYASNTAVTTVQRLASDLPVHTLLWLKGTSAYGLAFADGQDMFYSLTGAQIVVNTDDENSENSRKHALEPILGGTELTAVRAATTTSLDVLTGQPTLDGVALATGDRVLVKNQADSTQNGIYTVTASGTWTRSTGVDGGLTNSVRYVRVTEGTLYARSCWYNASYTSATTAVTWGCAWKRAAAVGGSDIVNSLTQGASGDETLASATNGLWRVVDTSNAPEDNVIPLDWPSALVKSADNWSVAMQGGCLAAVLAPRSDVARDRYLALSDQALGLWQAQDLADPAHSELTWTRCARVFNVRGQYDIGGVPADAVVLQPLSVYEQGTGAQVDGSDFTVNGDTQSVTFAVAQPIGRSLVFERDYQNYYAANGRWNADGADVVVYVNERPSLRSYTLYPDDGRVQFATGLSSTDVVSITILRDGAFLKNIGTIPHLELPSAFVVASIPTTYLAQDLAPQALTISLQDGSSLPANLSYIELRTSTQSERIPVTFATQAGQVLTDTLTVLRPRAAAATFPADTTAVYVVEQQSVLGLEDLLTMTESGFTYHLDSLIGDNLIQTQLAVRAALPNLYDTYSVGGQRADQGPTNELLFNFGTDLLDATASSSALRAENGPTSADRGAAPVSVQQFGQGTVVGSGAGLLIGSEKGVWRFDGQRWRQETDLGGAGRIYLLGQVGSVFSAGSDQGLWRRSVSDTGNVTWTKDATYRQPYYAYLSGGAQFGGTSWEAHGKSDGLAFVRYQQDGSFLSDHFDPLDGRRVFGLFYGQWQTIGGDTPTVSQHDGLYLCTEDGLWGLALGNRGGSFSSLFQGREMFGDARQTNSFLNPSGGQPIKFYRAFQSPRPKSVPLILLTSNGICTVRNWRWCDPTLATDAASSDDGTSLGSLDFTIEHTSLVGQSCQCYAWTSATRDDGSTLYKLFVGSDTGVSLSLDEGGTFAPCGKIAGGDTTIFDLYASGSCLWAATERGIFTSPDDGATWYRPGDAGNDCATFDPSVAPATRLNGGWLGQTFTALGTSATKASLYLAMDPLRAADAQDNTLKVELWSLTTEGAPQAKIAECTTTLTGASLPYPGWRSFVFDTPATTVVGQKYALLANEMNGTQGESAFFWYRSSLPSPYADGTALSQADTPSTMTAEAADDLFFRVAFAVEPVASETVVAVPLEDGDGRGWLIGDDGRLTTDAKLAIVGLFDDSASAAWSDPAGGSGRADQLQAILETLRARTRRPLFGGGNYDTTYCNLWSYGSVQLDLTQGFTQNDDVLSVALSTLTARGTASPLSDSGGIAFSSLNPQNIVDALINLEDQQGTRERVDALTVYLEGAGLLRLAETQSWYATQPQDPDTAWDGTRATISDHLDVASYVALHWANSFTPVAIVVADGDDSDIASRPSGPVDIATALATSWDGNGVGALALGLGASSEQRWLRTMADGTPGGAHFILAEGGADWSAALSQLVHGGSRNLFTASWSYAFDYVEPTWIRSVTAVFTPSVPSDATGECRVEVSYSFDRITYSPWIPLESGTPLLIDQAVLSIRYQAHLVDGWDGTESVRPALLSLSQITVAPATKILFTPPQPVTGSVFEYLLTANASIPRTSRLNWGIVRGESEDFADYEQILDSRRSCLPNRQQAIQFTTPIVRANLTAKQMDANGLLWQVYAENGAAAAWATTDLVEVFTTIGGVQIQYQSSQYSWDAESGTIGFLQAQQDPILVTVTTPAALYATRGEPTTTTDDRTYFLVNGPWLPDATVIVLVNNQIVRGGFFLSPDDGSVTFGKERDRSDLVTVYIQQAPTFRVGVEIVSYANGTVDLDSFGLIYTTSSDTGLLAEYNQSYRPDVLPGTLRLTPDPAVEGDTLAVTYEFVGLYGSTESGTQIRWYAGGALRSEYNDRSNVSASAFGAGAVVQVQVQVSDGDRIGFPRTTQQVTIGSGVRPYITSALIQVPGKQADTNDPNLSYAALGQALTAGYAFGPTFAEDDSVIAWYRQDASTPFAYGRTLVTSADGSGTVTSGDTVSFIVTPISQGIAGTPVYSDAVTLRR